MSYVGLGQTAGVAAQKGTALSLCDAGNKCEPGLASWGRSYIAQAEASGNPDYIASAVAQVLDRCGRVATGCAAKFAQLRGAAKQKADENKELMVKAVAEAEGNRLRLDKTGAASERNDYVEAKRLATEAEGRAVIAKGFSDTARKNVTDLEDVVRDSSADAQVVAYASQAQGMYAAAEQAAQAAWSLAAQCRAVAEKDILPPKVPSGQRPLPGGKTIVSIPECPAGQYRDPSGQCKTMLTTASMVGGNWWLYGTLAVATVGVAVIGKKKGWF